MPTYRSSLFPTFRERLLYAFVCTCASFMNWMEGAVAGWGLSLLVLGGCLYFWWHILRWMFS